MRINDLLIESTNQLDEGPKFNKFGQAVGNVAGMAAKGVGAVAGGIAGLGAAAKKGFQAGKSQVAAADDGPATGKPIAKKGVKAAPGTDPAAVDPATGATTNTTGGQTSGAPAKGKGFLSGVKAGLNKGLSALSDPSLSKGNAKGAKPAAGGTTTPPSATGINKAGATPASQDQAQAGQTMYSQVKANIDKLDKKGKQRILQLLQKSMAAPAAGAAPAAPERKPGASPAAGGTGFGYDGNTGLPFNSQAERDAGLAKQKADKASATQAAPAAEPAPATTTKRTGGRVKGQLSQNPRAVKRREANATKTQPEMASKINTGSMVLEGFNLFRKK
jgi:hypothetical protein